MDEIILTRRKTTIKNGIASVLEWKHHGVVADGRFFPKRSIGKRFSYTMPEARDGVSHTQSVEFIRKRNQMIRKAA